MLIYRHCNKNLTTGIFKIQKDYHNYLSNFPFDHRNFTVSKEVNENQQYSKKKIYFAKENSKFNIENSNTEKTSAMNVTHKKAAFATQVGAVVNLALALSKGCAGYSISSTALIADAANSIGDLLCDAVVYFTLSESRKRATKDNPWGRGKIEPLGKFI